MCWAPGSPAHDRPDDGRWIDRAVHRAERVRQPGGEPDPRWWAWGRRRQLGPAHPVPRRRGALSRDPLCYGTSGMHRTTARLRPDAAPQLAALKRQRPEWRAWLRLLAEVRAELDDPAWAEPLGGADGIVATGSASAEMPLLEGRTLLVDPQRLQRLLRRLARAAAKGNSSDAAALQQYRPSATEAMRSVEETAGQQPSGTGLAIVAELAALPLFRACERLLQGLMPTWWPHGHCPICGMADPGGAPRAGSD